MWDKIKQWLLDLGSILFKFTKTTAADVVRKYGDDILKIIVECGTMPNASGEAKMACAIGKLSLLVPGILEFVARAAIEVVYSTWKEGQLAELDTDGDGVPDYRDVCKELGVPEGGCVTADGCPDSDCDGTPDHLDPCPLDPHVR